MSVSLSVCLSIGLVCSWQSQSRSTIWSYITLFLSSATIGGPNWFEETIDRRFTILRKYCEWHEQRQWKRQRRARAACSAWLGPLGQHGWHLWHPSTGRSVGHIDHYCRVCGYLEALSAWGASGEVMLPGERETEAMLIDSSDLCSPILICNLHI